MELEYWKELFIFMSQFLNWTVQRGEQDCALLTVGRAVDNQEVPGTGPWGAPDQTGQLAETNS